MANTPELLAPSGNMECLHAAVSAGANAVYLGLDEFNARRNADNFTIESLKQACDYAHLRGVRIYVTLNVEILPGEFEAALTCARHAYKAGADAFIVQDVGLATEIKRTLPDAHIHASTQMNVHSAAGIEAAALLGVTRVTLARELSLEEVANLSEAAASFGIETESFAHGALCICYSGQCLMSSLIGGRSANRGLCAQACRLPYELHREGQDKALPSQGEHLLSPKDLCTVGILRELCETGVASLKIEGRMKSADYVHEVVSVYREALDALSDGKDVPSATVEHWNARLAEAFSRGFTTAYLEGERGNEMMSYKRPNNRGVFVGRVANVEGGIAEVSCETLLFPGDVVEFWTNQGHFTANVAGGNLGQGRMARIPINRKAGKGDRVFRVRNAATAFKDDAFEPRVPLSGNISLVKGEPARIRFTTRTDVQGTAKGDIVEAARTKSLTVDEVRAHIDRLGQTPFVLDDLEINLGKDVGMGFSQLHRLRTAALDNLTHTMLAPYENRSVRSGADSLPADAEVLQTFAVARQRQNTQEGAVDFEGRQTAKRNSACEVVAWATNPGCARAAKRAGASAVFVPLLNYRRGQSQACGIRLEEADRAGYPKQCLMALPAIDHDPISGTREEALSFDPWDYVREGKTVFADSMASALRALTSGAHVELGTHVPIMNEVSLQLAARLGLHRVWLSPELTLGQISTLAKNSPIELGLVVSGAQELMICEHCLLMSQGPCSQECETCPRRSVAHKLVDRKGFDFPVITDALGRSHLYNGIELDASSAIVDFLDMGISALMVDTTLMNEKTAESAVKRIIRARDCALEEHRSVERRPGTTTGHLYRGVS